MRWRAGHDGWNTAAYRKARGRLANFQSGIVTAIEAIAAHKAAAGIRPKHLCGRTASSRESYGIYKILGQRKTLKTERIALTRMHRLFWVRPLLSLVPGILGLLSHDLEQTPFQALFDVPPDLLRFVDVESVNIERPPVS